MIIAIALLSVAVMIVTKKTVDNFESQAIEILLLKQRVEELERALVQDECLRNEFNFTTRNPQNIEGIKC